MFTRYDRPARSTPVIYLIFGLAFACLALWLFGQVAGRATRIGFDAMVGVIRSLPIIFVAYMAAGLLVTSALAFGFLLEAWKCWFFLYEYRVTDSELEVHDPLLKRTRSVRFEDVERIGAFTISRTRIAKAVSPDTRGHVLRTVDGYAVRLSEELPIWLEIAQRCVNARFE